jgi:uncharacterized protein (TIGR00375 family)
MKYIADLHLHSKYSRAVSQQMMLPMMSQWARRKGLDIIATGDWTHPLWIRYITDLLEEKKEGLFGLKENKNSKDKEPLFILSTEISSIYSQGGKTRRVHNLVFSESIKTVEKINKEMRNRGFNLNSDGRPIIGLSSRNLLEMVLSIDKTAMLIPAHCLTPDSSIHTKEGIKQIKNISVGDMVYTHKNRVRKVIQIFRRQYKGKIFQIKPWYFSLGLATTSEHPFYAFHVKKCPTKGGRCIPTPSHRKICKKRIYESYKPQWLFAEKLNEGDILLYPRFQNTTAISHFPLGDSSKYKIVNGNIYTGGTRGHVFPQDICIDKSFCRLIGYYLAEGYTNGRDEVGFTFHEKEKAYIEDVINLMEDVFGISHSRIYRRKGCESIEISFYSKLLTRFFGKLFYEKYPHKATNKMIPDWMIHLPKDSQAELLRGWWRGDGGYTSSRQLMNGMKVICLRLGIIPSILKDTKEEHLQRGNHKYRNRNIEAMEDSYSFSHLAFFEDSYNLLFDPVFKDSIRKLSRRHGWIDENYIYIPIRKIIKKNYDGEVFNLEVEEDNSYVSEFATVHNCWTPWFSLYGSMSGFDSIEECFEDYSKYIFGIETGLSSDPEMNWRIKELDKRTILSSSDAHSMAKMGREATVFELKDLTFKNIRRAIIAPSLKPDFKFLPDKIAYTIEFYPEEGKYHYTGHRNCHVSQDPKETKEKGSICPVCKKNLTVGVMHRVEQLASLNEKQKSKIDDKGVKWIYDPRDIHPPFVKLVPLLEIVAESMSMTVSAQRVKDKFDQLCLFFGSEINVLLNASIDELEKQAGVKIAEGVKKVRKGDIVINPGFDGQYGVVKIWNNDNEESILGLDF